MFGKAPGSARSIDNGQGQHDPIATDVILFTHLLTETRLGSSLLLLRLKGAADFGCRSLLHLETGGNEDLVLFFRDLCLLRPFRRGGAERLVSKWRRSGDGKGKGGLLHPRPGGISSRKVASSRTSSAPAARSMLCNSTLMIFASRHTTLNDRP